MNEKHLSAGARADLREVCQTIRREATLQLPVEFEDATTRWLRRVIGLINDALAPSAIEASAVESVSSTTPATSDPQAQIALLRQAMSDARDAAAVLSDYRSVLSCGGTVDWPGEQVAEWAKNKADRFIAVIDAALAVTAPKADAASPKPQE